MPTLCSFSKDLNFYSFSMYLISQKVLPNCDIHFCSFCPALVQSTFFVHMCSTFWFHYSLHFVFVVQFLLSPPLVWYSMLLCKDLSGHKFPTGPSVKMWKEWDGPLSGATLALNRLEPPYEWEWFVPFMWPSSWLKISPHFLFTLVLFLFLSLYYYLFNLQAL